MTIYSNLPINYLSNINCKFIMRFDYHDNGFMRMKNLKHKKFVPKNEGKHNTP